MDWESKLPSWDMAEFETAGPESDMSSVVGAGGVGGREANELDWSVDLKLGGLGEFGKKTSDWGEQFNVPRTTMPVAASASSSVPTKRPRVLPVASQNASCLVEACKADLSKCRDYHRRHKVCEAHSKTPVVIVAGQEQRFCQQCSRFHLLAEFDEVKRSCRKRLEGHNRRRRKPHPDSLNSSRLFTSQQGSRFASYPHFFPASVPNPKWPGVVKAEIEPFQPHHHQPHFVNLHAKEKRQFPFLQDGEGVYSSRSTFEVPTCPPVTVVSESSSSSSKLFNISAGLTQVMDSDCALSLLSSPTPASAIHLRQVVEHAEAVQLGQSLVLDMQHGSLQHFYSLQPTTSHDASLTEFSCSRMEDRHFAGSFLSTEATANDLHYHSLYHVASEASDDGEAQTLPFSW